MPHSENRLLFALYEGKPSGRVYICLFSTRALSIFIALRSVVLASERNAFYLSEPFKGGQLTLSKPHLQTLGHRLTVYATRGKPKLTVYATISIRNGINNNRQPIPDNHYTTFEKYCKGFAPIFEIWYNKARYSSKPT